MMRQGLCCLFMSVVIGWSANARAQFVVSDPLNAAENAASAISEATTTIQQIKSVIMQTQQLANELKNLKKLDPRSWRDLQAALFRVHDLIQRAQRLATAWAYTAQNLVRLYGRYGPEYVSGQAYERKQKRWREDTDKALFEAIEADAQVMAAHADLSRESRGLEDQAQLVSGNLQAAELTAKTLAVIMRQQQLGNDLMLKNSHLDHLRMLQARREQSAARHRAAQIMGARMGAHETIAKPVLLIDF